MGPREQFRSIQHVVKCTERHHPQTPPHPHETTQPSTRGGPTTYRYLGWPSQQKVVERTTKDGGVKQKEVGVGDIVAENVR